MKIRAGDLDDLEELQRLFVGSVTEVCSIDYDNEQVAAWASGVENKQRWNDILTQQVVIVAQDGGRIAGFFSLADGHYIDLFYIHKDYQRRGVATRLYTEVENEAKHQGRTVLTSEVSKTARGFFERMGFTVLQEQTVRIKGVGLVNYRMEKRLIT
jgi:putative acetyltransferase